MQNYQKGSGRLTKRTAARRFFFPRGKKTARESTFFGGNHPENGAASKRKRKVSFSCSEMLRQNAGKIHKMQENSS